MIVVNRIAFIVTDLKGNYFDFSTNVHSKAVPLMQPFVRCIITICVEQFRTLNSNFRQWEMRKPVGSEEPLVHGRAELSIPPSIFFTSLLAMLPACNVPTNSKYARK